MLHPILIPFGPLGESGDITGITAGDGLSGGGATGDITVALDLVSNGGLEIASGEVQVAAGISQYDVAQFAASVVDNDFLRIDGTAVEGRSAAEVLSDIGAGAAAGSSSIVTTGALDTGSITSGFTSIDVGSGGITTTGAVAGGTFDATTDFTIGDTVITDGVITDSTGLSVAAATTVSGTVTVGVDDTGYDVKLFGASAGAFMLYDVSEDTLEIRGPSADATTSTGKLLLSTALTDINANDVLGKIDFQAPLETGTDAILVAASIQAMAQSTFAANSNATDIIFKTAHDAAAAERFRFTSQGELGVGGANYGTDGQVLTSAGAGAAPAWEDAGGGGAVTREGGTTIEATSTSTSSVDLLTTASLTIPAATPVLIYSNFRKTTGGSYRGRLGYKINSTEIKAPKYLEGAQTNQTFQIIQAQFIGPRVTNYLRCVSSIITGDSSTDGKISTTSSAEDGDVPNAEMTDAILRASVENASITAGADEQHVYILATS